MKLVKCQNCGAPILGREEDGCGYCGLGAAPVFDPGQLVAALASELEDVRAFAKTLAQMLGKAFPTHTKVEHSGFFSKELKVIAVEVKAHEYRLDISGREPKANRVRTVRGVRLKNDELALHEWLHSLMTDLAELARETRQDREAMKKVLT